MDVGIGRTFSETPGHPFGSGSAFMDEKPNAKDADAEEIRLIRMDSGAIRSGVLEKATKDAAAWKLRRCALHSEAFWYSKEATFELESGTDLRAARSQWTCIPLSNCVQLLRWPDDGRVFLVQTGSRSYYWRAKSQNEAEAWLLSIGTQCAALKEMELLRQAEDRTIRTEETHTAACLDFLHSLYRLEGTLRFHDTRELLHGFLVDFFRLPPNVKAPTGVEPRQPLVAQANGRPQLAVDSQETHKQQASHAMPGSLEGRPLYGRDVCSAGFTLREVQDFINTWASRHPDSSGSGAENCEDALNQQAEEASSDSDRRIGKWLRVEIFPKFISSPIIQRRIAQLAASGSVVNWGIDPLKSPLLASNTFDGGSS